MTTVKGRNGLKVRVPWSQEAKAGLAMIAASLATLAVVGYLLYRMGQV